MTWLECVPNISEGRRADVIERLTAATEGTGVALLDQSSDPDHNRTVLTLAGRAPALIEAVVRLAEAAAREIDLRRHEGVHPLIGALDVVPFVPLEGAEMSDAVAAAETCAQALAERLNLPCFLYEHAARARGRQNLADVRRGGFEALGERLAAEAWAPDYGPRRPHPRAGATAVGARFFLIAFNAVLDREDLGLARRVARRVRASNGGLPALKALGVPLPSHGRSQVSMNLVDFRRTSLPQALEAVRGAARDLGARVDSTELVGLVPAAAVAGLEAADLLLPELTRRQVLEHRLEDVLAERGLAHELGDEPAR